MRAAYAKAGLAEATSYRSWRTYSTFPYQSKAHAMRYVHNRGNARAPEYGRYEDGGTLPEGSVLAKDSFVLSMDGKIGVGPLFLMQKKRKGWNAAALDWNYVMIMPNGAVRQSKGIQNFCNECHWAAGPEDDNLMFLPDKYRVSGN